MTKYLAIFPEEVYFPDPICRIRLFNTKYLAQFTINETLKLKFFGNKEKLEEIQEKIKIYKIKKDNIDTKEFLNEEITKC